MSIRAASQYNKVGTQSGVEHANPHQLIQMLMAGALEKISIAKGHMERGNVAEKGRHISWAITIIGGLQASLDMEKGGEIAENLNHLYHYMSSQLLQANLQNQPELLNEVTMLMKNIKAGWDGIGQEAQAIFAQKDDAVAKTE